MTSAVSSHRFSVDPAVTCRSAELGGCRKRNRSQAGLEFIDGPVLCLDLTRSPHCCSRGTTVTHEDLSQSISSDADSDSLHTTATPFGSPGRLEQLAHSGTRLDDSTALSLELAAAEAPEVLAEILAWLDKPAQPLASVFPIQIVSCHAVSKSRRAMRADGRLVTFSSRRRATLFSK